MESFPRAHFSEEIIRLSLGLELTEIGNGIGEALGALYASSLTEKQANELVFAVIESFSAIVKNNDDAVEW